MPMYIGLAFAKSRKLGQTCEHTTREGALDDAFTRFPAATRVSVGYGYNGSFDVRSTNRVDWQEQIAART
jgi:hypothetical protein